MAYIPTSSKWIKVVKTFSDFSAAALTNAITVYTLPINGVIHATQIVPTTVFSGGTIATYTVSVGTAGTPTKYAAATSVFTGATIPATSVVVGMESNSATTAIQATAISTIGNLNAATQGSVNIYLLVSILE